MIFATTGTQLAFPRLMQALDTLAPELDEPIMAQIGPDGGSYPNLEIHAHLDPPAFEATFAQARVVVAHAGIGTILSAKRHGKPLVIMPRRHDLGEHRNDHQIATATQMQDHPGIEVAWNETDLAAWLKAPTLPPAQPDPGQQAAALIRYVAGWIDTAR